MGAMRLAFMAFLAPLALAGQASPSAAALAKPGLEAVSYTHLIDGKPSLVRFDRRRARTDLHFIPVILFGPHDEL